MGSDSPSLTQANAKGAAAIVSYNAASQADAWAHVHTSGASVKCLVTPLCNTLAQHGVGIETTANTSICACNGEGLFVICQVQAVSMARRIHHFGHPYPSTRSHSVRTPLPSPAMQRLNLRYSSANKPPSRGVHSIGQPSGRRCTQAGSAGSPLEVATRIC